jgi:predicted metalloprotease with PDZ domain
MPANPFRTRRRFALPIPYLLRRVLPVLAWSWLEFAAPFAASGAPPISYSIDLREPATHLAKVTLTIPEAEAGTQIQFPAWNALYQIRDFVKNVQELEARCDGRPFDLIRLDLYTWGAGGEPCAALEIRYSVYVNEDRVFSSILNEHHAYLNPAMVLFYLPRERGRAMRLRLLVPQSWKVATFLEDPAPDGVYSAANYDELADSPIEAGTFQEYQYQQNGALYRVIVDAGPNHYDPGRIIESLQKITAAATGLMQDVPFPRYTFLYHFGQETGGGMEHANGTAISFAASELRSNWLGFESVSAHEFVHAWNVKRIRPQNLEPVDYIRGNDTSDLWFAEGVASTLQEYILLRAGLLSRETFYTRLGGEINRLHERPARHTQSLEDAGREAWLEKYPDFQRPERSISYYNKGMIVGFLLDLAIRQATGSRRSLDDLFRRLNEDFAKHARYFTREDLIRIIEDVAGPGWDARQFFRDFVTGTRELEYDRYLSFAGLRLAGRTSEEGSLGFLAVRNLDGPITIQSVAEGGNAARAGLEAGDVLLEMNGKRLGSLPQDLLRGSKPRREVRFLVRRDGCELTVRFRLESGTRMAYHIEEMEHASREQIRLRDHWLKGTTAVATGAGK